MKTPHSIEFKGTVASFSALTVTLRSNDLAELAALLDEQCGGDSDFFNRDLALLDAEHLPGQGADMDWPALVALLRRHHLNPAVVRNAVPEAEPSIHLAGLTVAEDVEVAARKPTPAPEPPPVVEAAPAPVAPPPQIIETVVPAVVVDRPLRSGQQVYARNTDLVVMAMVNPGAEVIADGNIHVYAPLRGRALAGASGDTSARILTTCFEAELVSIGGVYRPLEPGSPPEVSGKPAQIRLATDEKTGKQDLRIEPLSTN